jgi:hypothetical protein
VWLINLRGGYRYATCQLAATCDIILSPQTVMGPESGDVVVRDFDGNVLSSQPPDCISFDGI